MPARSAKPVSSPGPSSILRERPSRTRLSGSMRPAPQRPKQAQAVEPVSDNDPILRITLQVAPFFEAVNVTSSRTGLPRADPTQTVTVLSSAELLTSAAATIDDALQL